VSAPLLVDYFKQLPVRRLKEEAAAWRARRQGGTDKFRRRVEGRYNEGTLMRLLDSPDPVARRAALTALGLVGTMAANAAVAARLRDDDAEARRLAGDTVWSLWFRADSDANNRQLQRLTRMRDRAKAMAGLDALVLKAPEFAEAYNQRAILAFRMKEYERSVADCEKVLALNPCHFGAQAGMGQCYLQLRKPRAALKSFRAALRINPDLDGVAETIRALETALGDGGPGRRTTE
jgi:tetratricopeptide (TPR) repeat protein